MDINQNSSGMMNGMPPINHNEKKVGPIVGALIIVLILIIAALYFFGQKLNTESTVPSDTSSQTSMETPTNSMTASASQADDVQTLQSDLDNQLKNVDYSF